MMDYLLIIKFVWKKLKIEKKICRFIEKINSIFFIF